MNHHDIRLIEIGQKEGYAKAVKEIVAWLQDWSCSSCGDVGRLIGGQIEDDFLEQKKNTFLQRPS